MMVLASNRTVEKVPVVEPAVEKVSEAV